VIGDTEIQAQRAIDDLKAGRRPSAEDMESLGIVTTLRWNRQCKPKVDALLAAGWTIEWPEHDLDTWQWAWRRPSRRTGRPGRRFASTGQAYNAMVREREGRDQELL
jgi:hypothetical protein